MKFKVNDIEFTVTARNSYDEQPTEKAVLYLMNYLSMALDLAARQSAPYNPAHASSFLADADSIFRTLREHGAYDHL